ncbi:MAG: sporulation protein YunB [Senegalia sp. (in: firmicutes)]
MKRKTFKKRYVIIVILIVFIIYSFLIIDKNIRPTILAISQVKARMVATQAINDAVKENIGEELQYKNLINLNYDNEGKLRTIQNNTMMMTKISSNIALAVQDEIRQIGIKKVRIPLGNALNSQLLSQYGPKVSMKMTPQGSVTVDFTSEFIESGINQTVHRVILIIKTNVRIIVPLATETEKVITQIPIAETVIVGEVPDSYISVPEKDFLNVVE